MDQSRSRASLTLNKGMFPSHRPHKIHDMLSKVVPGPSGTKEKPQQRQHIINFVSVRALEELVCLRPGSHRPTTDESADTDSSDSLRTSSDMFIWVKLLPRLRYSVGILRRDMRAT